MSGVPVLSGPEEGQGDGGLKSRLRALHSTFEDAFPGETPQIYLRVPGRVNLIGEHVDYSGYSVCPMALQQDILMAASVSQSDNFLELVNSDSSKYPDLVLPDEFFKIDLKETGWGSYVLCGVRGALELLSARPPTSATPPAHMKVAVSGSLPPASGLSSSSALVSAALLLTTRLNGVEMAKTELASLSAKCEQYIGTMGGGMDQAIAFLASKGCAKHIEFCPVRTEDVKLPENAVFVIAHSNVTKNKAASSDYNTRVVECRLAAQVLAKRHSLNWKKTVRLVEVQEALDIALSKMPALVRQVFHKEPYSKQEVCDELGVSEEELNELSLTPNTRQVHQFKLQQRALHVFEEASRVKEWCSVCKCGGGLQALGALMTESHQSLRHLYECSHPALDSLVSDCLNAGAFGARLTGAGWGGCVVALTTKADVDAFIDSIKQQFYGEDCPDVDSLIFATEPNHGAQIFLSV